MQHAVLKSLAAAGTLALAIAACSSSGTQSGSGTAAAGKTLVIESTSVTAPSQNFNPYVQSATGYSAQATGLIYEPLYIFNVMNPTQPPVPMLASGQPAWSNGGKLGPIAEPGEAGTTKAESFRQRQRMRLAGLQQAEENARQVGIGEVFAVR